MPEREIFQCKVLLCQFTIIWLVLRIYMNPPIYAETLNTNC